MPALAFAEHHEEKDDFGSILFHLGIENARSSLCIKVDETEMARNARHIFQATDLDGINSSLSHTVNDKHVVVT